MIRSGLILMIKDLAGKGKSAYAIGQEIGVSKNTARKSMTQPAQPHGLKGIKKGSKLDPYKEQLDSLMQQGVSSTAWYCWNGCGRWGMTAG